MPVVVEVSPTTLPTDMADSGGNFPVTGRSLGSKCNVDWIWAFHQI